MDKIVKRSRRLKGEVVLPGDRSISHQAAILAAISEGESLIRNFSDSLECRKTLDCLRLLGVACELEGRDLKIAGVGRDGLTAPSQPLDAGNSDTTMYLLAAILAPQPFSCEIEGGSYLQRRSPEEVIDPLIQMGANIVHPEGAGAPLNITGGPLIGIHYSLPFPSALTKSAILLAGLYAEGETTVMEKIPTRDHTERLLKCFGVELGTVSLDQRDKRAESRDDLSYRLRKAQSINETEFKGMNIVISKPEVLSGREIQIPNDFSVAAPFIAAATVLTNSNVNFPNLSLNPSRAGFLELLKRMGGNVTIRERREVCEEPLAHVSIRTAGLKSRRVGGSLIANLLDEIPVLAVMATQAEGTTVIRGAQGLRTKETDRIKAIYANLRKMGARVGELEDGLVIEGKASLEGAEIDTAGDHLIAMAFAIAGLVAQGETVIKDAECVEKSFPGFWDNLENLI